jgi:hypothetical protein
MSISEPFRYRNDVFQSDIFVSDIGITDVDVGYQISPTLRSMSTPTYGKLTLFLPALLKKPQSVNFVYARKNYSTYKNLARAIAQVPSIDG